MHSIDCVDSAFDITNFSNYKLSIQVALNGLSFCIQDKLAKKFIALKFYPIKTDLLKEDFYKKVEDIINDDKELKGDFDSVSFMFCTNKCTMVPSIFFDINNLKKYFEFNQHMDDLDELHYDMINEIDGFNVYTVPNQIAIDISRKFPEVKFFHHATSFIKNNIKQNTSLIGYKVFIQLNYDFFDIIITKARDLILFNTFKYKNADDLVFFVCYIFNQFNLSFENVDITLQGNTLDPAEYENKLGEYFKNVKVERPLSSSMYSDTIKTEYRQSYHNLFNRLTCV